MRKKRRHLRRLDQIYVPSCAPVFFITCCVHGRSPRLANTTAARVLLDGWNAALEVHGWAVGRYVVMPDHVHFFASPCADTAQTVSAFVGGWKSWTWKEIRARADASFEWQREFFDHLLRSAESYGQKWEYVRANSVRSGLANSPDEWPYQGEIHTLEW